MKPKIKVEQLSDGVTLYLGDCHDILPTLGKVDVVITDPPYGVLVPGDFNNRVRDDRGGKHGLAVVEYTNYSDTYMNFVRLIAPRINEAIDLVERAAIFTGPHIHDQRKPDAIGGVYCASAMGRNQWGFKNFLPVLLYGVAPDLHLGARTPTVIASSAVSEDINHPCPKPFAWMRWLVILTSRKTEVILDPFMGSGTTGVACVKLNRKFIGIEIEPTYFDIACKRVEKALKEPNLFQEIPIKRKRMNFGETWGA